MASAVGKPKRVDHATTAFNRPSMARILIEYNVSQSLIPRVWIEENEMLVFGIMWFLSRFHNILFLANTLSILILLAMSLISFYGSLIVPLGPTQILL